jgi:hypothetical protein
MAAAVAGVLHRFDEIVTFWVAVPYFLHTLIKVHLT